ncbi:MAG TPA: DUF3107 domain-containing protein [Acidimicrobiales bacterium]|nr:DUF3107 domain-containing protein [Acidimicrobiales bacterium]
MDVRIGVTQTAREIEVELADDADPAAVRATVEEALADEGKVLWFTDRRGRQIGVPSVKVAYVEIGTPSDSRRIGFGG